MLLFAPPTLENMQCNMQNMSSDQDRLQSNIAIEYKNNVKNMQKTQKTQNMQNKQNTQINTQKNTQGIRRIRIEICKIPKIRKIIRKKHVDNIINMQ
jgi:hypothetical protein